MFYNPISLLLIPFTTSLVLKYSTTIHSHTSLFLASQYNSSISAAIPPLAGHVRPGETYFLRVKLFDEVSAKMITSFNINHT